MVKRMKTKNNKLSLDNIKKAFKYTKRAGLLGLVGNVMLLIIKVDKKKNKIYKYHWCYTSVILLQKYLLKIIFT